jgi:nucleotide-binding universal stress UspA family protein/predicted membrane protein
MAHVSHRLSNSFQGALAGGGDPATSPLYVFGPFLRLIVVGGVASITFGASVWLVVITVATVSAMYRQVMRWVTDGSGGSGLSEEEFGGWAVKINAGITFVEYTLTFLVSVAALVTLITDRYPVLNERVLGFQNRTLLAIALTVLIGWLVNRGPRTAARAFGPATLGVLVLLWAMIIATIWKLGFRLPSLDLQAFHPQYWKFTFGGYARLLALMTGIEVFANLVAAYQGTAQEKSRKAFRSLLIIMGTTCATMLIVGPAILELSDPTQEHVSVFTQTMDRLLPSPLPYLGTLIGIVVLGSASAASAQGLQNLALGLRYRHYIPAPLGQRNRFDVADKPVWIQVGIVVACYLAFGTKEETYLALYAIGVFVLLSMTGWAAAKRLLRVTRTQPSFDHLGSLAGTIVAALLTSGATIIIVIERFQEGAWTYLLFIPILYAAFTYFRQRLGEPVPLDEHLGRLFVGQYLLPYQREGRPEQEQIFYDLVVPLDGSPLAESALPVAERICRSFDCHLTLVSSREPGDLQAATGSGEDTSSQRNDAENYLNQVAGQLRLAHLEVDLTTEAGHPEQVVPILAQDVGADLIVMTTHGRSGVERTFLSSASEKIIRRARTPVLLIRPTEEWRSRRTHFTRLLVSLDGSQSAERVLRYARTIARKFQSEILLLAVPEADSEEPKLRKYTESVAAALRTNGFLVRSIVTGSGPARTIVSVSESEGVDLIMLATHGRGGLVRHVPIGSVADRIIQITQVPVFLVPARM